MFKCGVGETVEHYQAFTAARTDPAGFARFAGFAGTVCAAWGRRP
jgi:hypothetical protein